MTNSEIAELLARAVRVARYQRPPMPESAGRSPIQIARSERFRAGWNEGYATALRDGRKGGGLEV